MKHIFCSSPRYFRFPLVSMAIKESDPVLCSETFECFIGRIIAESFQLFRKRINRRKRP